MIIRSKIETAPSRVDMNKIKQVLFDLQKVKVEKFEAKIKMVASKISFSFLLEKANSMELSQLSINFNEFLLKVIEEFPERIMSTKATFCILPLTELKNINIAEEDFKFMLSKQKGIIQFLIFQQSLNEKQIKQVGKDLELFEELFIKESLSQFSKQKIEEIC
ncbi:unnamed protein product [Paramecium octaurelia]|uniref:Uncharacterized protein n=1 Tax=Paramecium octaurelia TaxID=43137 RepID=A0A8S1Y5A4_PAROT|nr:unnamed protein product [Paramecium octaurelia]